MADVNDLYPAASKESEIDARLDDLIARLMSSDANEKDLIEYQELLATRARLMRPPSLRVRLASPLRRKFA